VLRLLRTDPPSVPRLRRPRLDPPPKRDPVVDCLGSLVTGDARPAPGSESVLARLPNQLTDPRSERAVAAAPRWATQGEMPRSGAAHKSVTPGSVRQGPDKHHDDRDGELR
jgi:hypothetical protein